MTIHTSKANLSPLMRARAACGGKITKIIRHYLAEQDIRNLYLQFPPDQTNLFKMQQQFDTQQAQVKVLNAGIKPEIIQI